MTRRTWTHVAEASVLLIVVLALALAWLFGNAMTGRWAVPASPLPDGAQAVRMTASDGISLVGHFWPGRDTHAPGVVLLHGQGSSRAQFEGMGDMLSDAGYAVLAINFRALGESEGDLRSFGLF